MSQPRRQLILNTFFMRFGHHPAAWRHRSAHADGRPDTEYWIGMARLAERAKFHTFFLADFVGRAGDDLEGQSRVGGSFQFEPLTLLSHIAAATRHIGLVATVNTNFEHPYSVARKLASLDHLSGGRAGWNVVSSLSEWSARNFGLEQPLTHGERYEQAEEFLDVARALWDSWDDEAFARPDRAKGRFFDPAVAHPVRHEGKYFRSEGLLDIARPIQGYPVLVQAGNSDTGREFAAKIAEMIYASAQSLDVAKAYYADVKAAWRSTAATPDSLKVTPGLSVVVAPTDTEAQASSTSCRRMVDFSRTLPPRRRRLSSTHPLDGPLPDLPEGPNGKGRARSSSSCEAARTSPSASWCCALVWLPRARPGDRLGQDRGRHRSRSGSWSAARTASTSCPRSCRAGFEDFVALVVPELQRRGLFRTEYTGSTYRESLGLHRPRNPHTLLPTQHPGSSVAADHAAEDAQAAGRAGLRAGTAGATV